MMLLLCVIFAMCWTENNSAFTMTEEQAKNLRDQLECIKETGADIRTLLNIKHGIPTLYDDKVNCFAACMLEKLKIMKPDGTLDGKVARIRAAKSMSEEKMNTVIEACNPKVGKSKCEIGGEILECLIKNNAVPVQR